MKESNDSKSSEVCTLKWWAISCSGRAWSLATECHLLNTVDNTCNVCCRLRETLLSSLYNDVSQTCDDLAARTLANLTSYLYTLSLVTVTDDNCTRRKSYACNSCFRSSAALTDKHYTVSQKSSSFYFCDYWMMTDFDDICQLRKFETKELFFSCNIQFVCEYYIIKEQICFHCKKNSRLTQR